MSYVRARQSFKDAQRAIKTNHDAPLLSIVEGLLQLTTSLEKHVAELHSEIVEIRRKVGGRETRKARTSASRRG